MVKNKKIRILFSIPRVHHIEIALDEMNGLQEIGYTCDQFPYGAQSSGHSKLGRLWVILKNTLSLVKISYQFRPDIIYFNSRLEKIAGFRDFITIVIFKTLYFRNVKFIIKSHGSDLEIFQQKSTFIYKIVLPFLKKNIQAWLFLSQEEKQKLNEIGYFETNKIFTTKNIVRVDQFTADPAFRNNYQIPGSSSILLFVGRIIREKGVFEVLEAFAICCKEFDSVLIIVGNGSEFKNLKLRIEELGIEDQVILTGFVPEQDVIPFYSNADILVFPTYFPEGFPMALFNSVAAGLGIITCKIRAATDYLTEPDNCLWAKPKNNSSVYNTMISLITNKKMLCNMKVNNKQKAKIFIKRVISEELSVIMENLNS